MTTLPTAITWREETLTGWGRYPRYSAQSALFTDRDQRDQLFEQDAPHPLLAFGLGRSYGDAGLPPAHGGAIRTTALNRILDFDPSTGWVRCEAGLSIYDLIDIFLPRGFFPPVVPGTQFVTVGGAIANDIHGKNHHVDGTFSDHVRRVELLTATGEVIFCDAEEHHELFWATVGGLGLTGVILSLEVRLASVGGPGIEMESMRIRDLDHFFEVSAMSADYTHTVSWIDCAARGSAMGRGIFMRGRHTDLRPNSKLTDRFMKMASPLLTIPFDAPNFLLNPMTIRAFNELYYRKHPKNPLSQVVPFTPFFFPLDAIRSWNKIYGRRGFLQYQLVVPHCPEHRAIRQILEEITKSGMGSFLAVIKEFGQAVHQGLSFPQPGVTLALDFPNYGAELLDLLNRLDLIVMSVGGRVYLGKDARLPKAHFQEMYPEWTTWKTVRDRWDPRGVFASALGDRLGLSASGSR